MSIELEASTRAAVARLWERHQARMVARIDVLEAFAVATLEGRPDAAAQHHAEEEAHRLAASLGTFGHHHAARMAREVELLVGAGTDAQAADTLRLTDLVVALRREVGLAAVPQAPDEGAAVNAGFASSPRTIYVIGRDDERVSELEDAATSRGFSLVRFDSVETFQHALGLARQGVVLFFLGEGDMDDARRLLALLPSTIGHGEAPSALPVITIMAHESLHDRVELSNLGALFVLSANSVPQQIVEALDHAVERSRMHRPTVLVIDDDTSVLATVSTVLTARGMHVHTLQRATEVWEPLDRLEPDALLLDHEMPDLDGVSLCRAIRHDPRYVGLPILLLTAVSAPDVVDEIYEAGADDFVTKSFLSNVLPRRVEQRLERAALQARLVSTDSLTGAMISERAGEVVERMLAQALEQSSTLTIALFDVDGLHLINERFGAPAGDMTLRRVSQVLLRQFRSYDVVARWGGKSFLVVMFGHDEAEGTHRAVQASAAVRRDRVVHDASAEVVSVTVSVGVSRFPADGADFASLVRAAECALITARKDGGDTVRWAGARGQGRPLEWYDVILVEEDDAIAGLLIHALTIRGLRTHRMRDGGEAAEMLTGDAPTLASRLLLLDANLPSMSGVSLLRRMSKKGLLTRTRVIMLTARAQEDEVVLCLELGAFDHVAKPFSMAVLMQRVRRALA